MIEQHETGTSATMWHKTDTSGSAYVHPQNETPAALAGATGAERFTTDIVPEAYRNRAAAATALCHAIAECDRADAVLIMDAALSDLGMGTPLPTFLSAMDDARWWASLAAPHELKAFALACYEAMRPAVRNRFLSYLQRGAA